MTDRGRRMTAVAKHASGTAPIPAAVAGTGHGLRVLVPALRASGFEVVALVGNDRERTRRRAGRAGIALAGTDLREMLRASGASAVAVATTPPTHAPLVQVALEHGCHVLCEKPFAMNAAEARSMLEAAERAQVTHLVGNQFRLMPERVVMGEAIRRGRIGTPRLLTIIQYHDLLADPGTKRPAWWFDRALGGGWLGASGSHMIDMIRTWLGEFESLSAMLPVVAAREGVAEDTFSLRFTLQNGVEGQLMQTGAAWGDFTSLTRVAGTGGTLSMEAGTVYLMDREGRRILPIPEAFRLPKPAVEDPRNPYLSVELPPAMRLCETWRDLIEGRQPAGHLRPATFADGLACMQVIDAVRESAARGGARVTVPL